MKYPIEKHIRKNILKLIPYSSARSEFKGKAKVLLDANENPFGKYNRYPDPFQVALKQEIAKVKNVEPTQIFLMNGSDGIVDLSFRLFCEPGKDKAMIFPPTFGMYTVAAGINNIGLIKIPLKEGFQIDLKAAKPHLEDPDLKLVFICSPNNPTGNHMNTATIDYILAHFKGIVVLDEAYIDFNSRPSYTTQLNQYPRLVILHTLSKSWALAGARIGMAITSPELVHFYNKIKTPYNLSFIDQKAALEALKDQKSFEEHLSIILAEKERMKVFFSHCPLIKKLYPTDANFFLVKVDNAEKIYKALTEKGIIVRNQNRILPDCLRITVGKPEENDQLIQTLEELK